MRRRTGVAALILLVAPVVSGRAQAQDHRVSFTGYLGGAGYSNLAGQLDPGVMLESSSFYGGMAELWFGRLGLRLHAGFGSPTVQDVPDTGFDIVTGDLYLVARFRRPRPGLFFQPYGVLGLGALRYDLGTDATDVAGFSYPDNPTTRGTLVLGIGTDLGSGPVAVRLEMMDIVGFSSPLSQGDGSFYDPVGHVVFTFGLSLRAGTIQLPPPPEPTRPPVTRVKPEPQPQPRPQPRDTVRTPRDTASAPRDSIRYRPRIPDTPETVPDTVPTDTVTESPDTTGLSPEAADTTPTTPAPPPPDDPGGEPRDSAVSGPLVLIPVDTTVAPEPPDTTSAPTDPADPPPDTTSIPTDTTDATDPGDAPDPGDRGNQGQLFAVRVSWDPAYPADVTAVASLLAVLEAADVPVWPPESDPDQAGEHRRVAALTNAAAARVLGNHIVDAYGLGAEWVHIDKDEDVPQEAVDASTAFVDGLKDGGQGPGKPATGRDGPPKPGGPPK